MKVNKFVIIALSGVLAMGSGNLVLFNSLTKEKAKNELLTLKLKSEKEVNTQQKKILKAKDVKLTNLTTELRRQTQLNRGATRRIEYNPLNLREVSGVTVSRLSKSLEGTALQELAPAFIEAEKLHQVNALAIVGLVANESGWGTSTRAIRDNNLTGYGVYHDGAVGINPGSKEESILYTARKLSEDYLNPDGQYYNGASLDAVNLRYSVLSDKSPNRDWAKAINQIALSLKSEINNK